MKKTQKLYLFGGREAIDEYTNEFVASAGGSFSKIVVLSQSQKGWKKHRAAITARWEKAGVQEISAIYPGENGEINIEDTQKRLDGATGIFIGGGDTQIYHQLYASGLIREKVIERYERRVPIAGVSAGALIMLEKCHYFQEEGNIETVQIVNGMSLVKDLLLGVHISKEQSLERLLVVLSRTKSRIGIGIDDSSCIVCEDKKISQCLGQGVFKIEVKDFESMTYTKTKIGCETFPAE